MVRGNFSSDENLLLYDTTNEMRLQPTSPYNFSSAFNRNAIFMDECKLTDNQFEQWKLIAGRQPMNTDMTYKSQHIVKDCIMYTASNQEIGTYKYHHATKQYKKEQFNSILL
ncbi:unnamed protein product [Euphydryas editha]|uniref:Uncharacterized protein n=1 Tax=Euphydryas editha TaxID=104508 RepID=A0AAU9TVR9_EUPED|nr:unnamed protein product [Euphydryas editha]